MATYVYEEPLADELPRPNRAATIRHLLRSRMIGHPAVYLPLARRRYPGPSPTVVDDRTELVVDGYMRSANTFAVYALQLAQRRPVRLAHHLHAPAQLLEAVRRGVPALALIREPEGVILSQVQWEPGVSMHAALTTYARFYSQLLPVATRLVIGEFSEMTDNPGAVIARANERFGTALDLPSSTPEYRRRCFELMQERASRIPEWYEAVLRFESGAITLAQLEASRPAPGSTPPVDTRGAARRTAVLRTPDNPRDAWIPSERRAAIDRALRRRYRSHELARLREHAEAVYATFLSTAAVPDAERPQRRHA
jgi:hypothetical protein